MSTYPKHALILAGSRGPTDPVAQSKGLPHKALVPVDEVPMLERVVGTLFASDGIDHIILSTDNALAEHGFGPVLAKEIEAGRITLATPRKSPSESVAHILEAMPGCADFPLLITTADHPLLTVPMVKHFCDRARGNADLVIGLAEAEVISGRYP
ncbi:MAG: NTP transferase domain-containing protein, partial [Geminicoccaceae bacterium]